MSFDVGTITDRRTFLIAKGNTLIDLLKDLLIRNVRFMTLETSIKNWIEAWTNLNDASLEAINKHLHERYEYGVELQDRIDEFIDDLIQLKGVLTNFRMNRYDRTIRRLEKRLEDIKKLTIKKT